MATHTITFIYNANGGSPTPQASSTSFVVSSYPKSVTKSITSVTPSKQYYSFLGWSYSQNATSASYASGGQWSFTITEGSSTSIARTFYAVYKHATAVVSYNANGGSGAPTAQTVNQNEWFNLRSGVPTRQYYDFVGWATSATATTAQYQPSGQARIVSNMTLYAVWKKSADVINASNGTMGTAMSLTITKADVSFTDDITYQFGSATGTIVSGTTLTTISWTPPTTLAAQIPNASSGSLVLTCKTYNGGTLVGTTTKTVTLSVPQSLAPTASVTIADTDATCLSWGIYVQSRSKLSFSISASGQQSATIASYRTTVNGTQYTGATCTTDVLLYSGTNTYTIVVTDSRGLQTTVTGTFNVEAYAVPSVTLVSCDRNDSDAEQVDVTFDFTVASVSNNNTAQYAIDYKKKTSITWTTGTVVSCGGYSGTISDSLSGIDQGDEYDIRVRVIDAFAEASVETEVGASGNIMLHSRHIGGAGLLMKSQAENQLDVGKPTVHHGAVLEQFGSTVYQHKTSGNYAKVLTFSTDVQVGKNLLNDVDPDVKNAYITGANKLGASPINRVVIIPINQNTYYTFTWNRVAIPGAGSDDTNVLLFSEYPVIGTTVGTSTGVNMSSNPAVRTFNSGSNIYAAIKIANTDKTTYQDTLSASQLELGQSSTPHEAYVNPSNINVNAPITIEYAKTGDTSPTTLTIVFNRDYTLQSFTKNTSADAYLHNSATAVWDLYIGKANSSDSVEILDMHNPWSNSDMTVTWGNTSISTLPTGYVTAQKVNGMIQCGIASAITISAGTYADIPVVFPVQFPSVPTVVVSLYTSSTGYGMGSVTAVVCQGTITTTGFTIRCYNNDTVGRAPAYTWIAML